MKAFLNIYMHFKDFKLDSQLISMLEYTSDDNITFMTQEQHDSILFATTMQLEPEWTPELLELMRYLILTPSLEIICDRWLKQTGNVRLFELCETLSIKISFRKEWFTATNPDIIDRHDLLFRKQLLQRATQLTGVEDYFIRDDELRPTARLNYTRFNYDGTMESDEFITRGIINIKALISFAEKKYPDWSSSESDGEWTCYKYSRCRYCDGKLNENKRCKSCFDKLKSCRRILFRTQQIKHELMIRAAHCPDTTVNFHADS